MPVPGAACLVPAGRTGGGDGSAPRAVGALVLPPNQRLERTGEAMGGSMQEPAAAAQPQVVGRLYARQALGRLSGRVR